MRCSLLRFRGKPYEPRPSTKEHCRRERNKSQNCERSAWQRKPPTGNAQETPAPRKQLPRLRSHRTEAIAFSACQIRRSTAAMTISIRARRASLREDAKHPISAGCWLVGRQLTETRRSGAGRCCRKSRNLGVPVFSAQGTTIRKSALDLLPRAVSGLHIARVRSQLPCRPKTAAKPVRP